MIGAKYSVRESLVTTDDRESYDDDETTIDRCRGRIGRCGNFGTAIDRSIDRKTRSVTGIRNSKQSVRRSAALVARNGKVQNRTCRETPRPKKFACCERCLNSRPRGQQHRSEINIRRSGGSISRGDTGTRASRTTSTSSFHACSRRTRYDLINNPRRKNNCIKFPPPRRLSSVTENKGLPRSRNRCCCSTPDRGPAFENLRPESVPTEPRIAPQNLPRRVIAVGSSTDEENVDYQVPIEYSRSCSSRTRTLVPVSSHITVRICPADSESSIDCDHRDNRSSDSDTSLNRLEERVGRGLRAMRCCCSDGAENRDLGSVNGVRNTGESESECHGTPPKPFSSCPPPRVLETLPKTARNRRAAPESRGKTGRCYCNKCRERLFNSSKKSDVVDESIKKWKGTFFEETHEDISTAENDDPLFERRARNRRAPSPKPNRNRSTCPRPRRGNNICESRNRGLSIVVDEKGNRGRFIRDKMIDHTIVLSAPEYRDFLNRCEGIRRSIRSMMRDEGTTNFLHQPAERDSATPSPPSSPHPSPKNGSQCCPSTLDNLRPKLPSMEHWSQYGDRMRDVANEYKRLRLYLNRMSSNIEKSVPSCSARSSSVLNSTKRWEKKTEVISPKESEVKEKRCCHCSKISNVNSNRDVGGNERSVWFEKIKRQKDNCSNDCNRNDVNKIEESCATMRAREADLVKTLETFCEKIKRVKSEFDKPFVAGRRVTEASLPCDKKPRLLNDCRCSSRCKRPKSWGKYRGKFKAKKLLIFPPEGEDGPPLTLFKNSSSVNCRVKGDAKTGFRYNVTYVQRFVSSTWYPSGKENDECSIDSG